MTKRRSDVDRWKKIVRAFPSISVTVLADLVADEFVFGEIARVSREAPVLILKHRERTVVPGGGASGADCTGPGMAEACPGGAGRAGRTRPCGRTGTSSSSSGGG